ncbi:MBL fold metallo-hydrolase [Nonomuraea pusilla]|uniref:MBL fold metallo-hydrolase n=1 Tax=Nonomuraea pusilla TaxID=46177 RepID=UPI00210C2371|nr:MBL fold metallo-hydrolase [Nonomuraea pusilla]
MRNCGGRGPRTWTCSPASARGSRPSSRTWSSSTRTSSTTRRRDRPRRAAGGGRRTELRTWGAAHTGSDQTVLVDGRVLFCGDLVETRMFPIAPYFPPYDADVDADHWITVLDRLLALGPAAVVPGHGEVADAGLLTEVGDYLRRVRSRTAELKAAGASEEQAVAAPRPRGAHRPGVRSRRRRPARARGRRAGLTKCGTIGCSWPPPGWRMPGCTP